MLPLSPLLSREELTRLGLDLPSRLVPALPLAPRLDTEVRNRLDASAMLQTKVKLVENAIEASSSSGLAQPFTARATQSTSVSGGRRSILPVRVSPLRRLISSVGSDSFNSDGSSVQTEPVAEMKDQMKGKKRASILRPSSYGTPQRSVEVGKVSSVESDIPSLAPSDTSDAQPPFSESGCFEDSYHLLSKLSPTATKHDIVFDPRVLVREFSRDEEEASTIWYTSEEMKSFKLEATKRILAFTRTEIIPTGTGRMIERVVTPTSTKVLFSHAALKVDAVDLPFPAFDSVNGVSSSIASDNIKKILIVDPYDICLKLFSKAFQQAMPGVIISTSRTSEEALKQVIKTDFDLIIVEERLKLFHRPQPGVCGNMNASGSLLLQRIADITKNRAILVGVSAHLPEDSQRLKDVGKADLLWGKPPPPLTRELLMQLENMHASKRENNDTDTGLC